MTTTLNPDNSVTLTLSEIELCTIQEALSIRVSVAHNTRTGYLGDRLPEADVERANQLEQRLFQLWCSLDDQKKNS